RRTSPSASPRAPPLPPAALPGQGPARLLRGGLRRGGLARDLEERVRQRDRADVLRKLRVHDEDHREAPRFVAAELLLLEAEALDRAEVRRRLRRRVARS